MILEITSSIISFVAGGGLVGIYTLKQTKESKNLDNATKLVNEYKDLLDKYKNHSEENESKIKELDSELSSLKIQFSELSQQLRTAQLLYENAEVLRCENLGCPKRVPPLNKQALINLSSQDNADNR